MSNVQKLVDVLPTSHAHTHTHTHTHAHAQIPASRGQEKQGTGRVAFCESRTRRLGGQGAGVQQAGVVRADLSRASPPPWVLLSRVYQLCNRESTHSAPLSPTSPAPSRHRALQAHLSRFGADNLGHGHSPAHWHGVSSVSAHARLQPRERWLLEAC